MGQSCVLSSCRAPDGICVPCPVQAAPRSNESWRLFLRASLLLGESQEDAGLRELTCAFPHPLGGWFSIWQLCLGQSPSCSAWCESLEKVGAGWGVEWGMGLLQRKCVWRKSLVLSFFLW